MKIIIDYFHISANATKTQSLNNKQNQIIFGWQNILSDFAGKFSASEAHYNALINETVK
jgi:hypothetical protein